MATKDGAGIWFCGLFARAQLSQAEGKALQEALRVDVDLDADRALFLRPVGEPGCEEILQAGLEPGMDQQAEAVAFAQNGDGCLGRAEKGDAAGGGGRAAERAGVAFGLAPGGGSGTPSAACSRANRGARPGKRASTRGTASVLARTQGRRRSIWLASAAHQR